MTSHLRVAETSVVLSSEDKRDVELINQMAAGDEWSFRDFYRRHNLVASRLALRILRNRELAEDAVQDGFLGAWQNAARYNPTRAKPSSWLLTFVHRRAVDLVRRAEVRTADPLETVPSESLGVDDKAIENVVEHAWVLQALHRLPAADRELLGLAYLQGLTQTQIAELKAVPLGTIKSRTFAALERLRAHEAVA